jgi:hypothetical protein
MENFAEFIMTNNVFPSSEENMTTSTHSDIADVDGQSLENQIKYKKKQTLQTKNLQIGGDKTFQKEDEEKNKYPNGGFPPIYITTKERTEEKIMKKRGFGGNKLSSISIRDIMKK